MLIENAEQNMGVDNGRNPAESEAVSRVLAVAVSYHLKGAREEALKVLEGLDTNIRPEDAAEILAARGHVQFELGRYQDALSSYKDLAGIRPKDATVQFNLGLSLQNLARYAEALENFRKSLTLGAKPLEPQLAIGTCLLHLNRHAEALEAFDAALDLAPESEAALFGKAAAL